MKNIPDSEILEFLTIYPTILSANYILRSNQSCLPAWLKKYFKLSGERNIHAQFTIWVGWGWSN